MIICLDFDCHPITVGCKGSRWILEAAARPCIQDTLSSRARALGLAAAECVREQRYLVYNARPSARTQRGYLVYKAKNCIGRVKSRDTAIYESMSSFSSGLGLGLSGYGEG